MSGDNGRTKRLIVAITGATGAILGIRALKVLSEMGVETHLILSRWAKATISLETDLKPEEVQRMASRCHSAEDMAATISSGSVWTDGMLVIPCSMRTLSGIRHGFGDSLVTRAADVVIKERRRLVLVPREMPLSEIHLENMLALARMGVSIVPPMPAFYNKPESVDDIVDHIVARALDQLGIEVPSAKRWKGVRCS
jgi:4-hydroxy-3-polyprenylbenzoate decarboxylase